MKEIRVVISRGGKVAIDAKGLNGQNTFQFTEKLAKDLGKITERHQGENYDSNYSEQQQNQGV